MRNNRRKGFVLSALMHLTILLFAIFGLPSILDHSMPQAPAAITVELLPIMDTTNVKPSETKPAPEEKKDEKKEEKKEAPPVKVEKQEPKKPTPPVKTAENTPPPPDKLSEKKDKPKEEQEQKKDPKKNKATEEDLAAVLKAVRETAQKQKTEESPADQSESTSPSKSTSSNYDPTKALSMSEQDAIRSQIMRCWNVPAGAKNAHELIVVLRIQLQQDGSLIQVELANESKSRYSADPFFRAAADSAMRAVRQCTPLKNLPPEKYQTWRDLELNFNPTDMLL